MPSRPPELDALEARLGLTHALAQSAQQAATIGLIEIPNIQSTFAQTPFMGMTPVRSSGKLGLAVVVGSVLFGNGATPESVTIQVRRNGILVGSPIVISGSDVVLNTKGVHDLTALARLGSVSVTPGDVTTLDGAYVAGTVQNSPTISFALSLI